MTGRHHYSLPGASFLKPRGSVKAQIQQQKAAPANNVSSSSRDTRQPTSRAYHGQEAVAGTTPVRPPSATAYRPQHSSTSVNGFHASSSTRQASVQRPTTIPPASSSRTRLDVPDSRGYFAKMFSRKQTTPTPAQASEKGKSSHKQHRTSVTPAFPPQAPYPSGPSASRTSFDVQPQRDADKEDQKKQRVKDDRIAAERTKEERERRRAEYAAYKARLEEVEREQASATKARHIDRAAPRPSQEDRRQQEYEYECARRRPQPQTTAEHSQKQDARQSQYLHYSQTPAPLGYRVMTPARDGQQMFAQQPIARPPGVPAQPSSSSHSTSASNQAQPSHSALYPTRMDPIGNPNPVSTAIPSVVPHPAPVLPPKGNSASHRASNHPLTQHASQQSHFTPPGLATLPSYQSSGPDYRQRLDREAAEREALLSKERERIEAEREALFKRRESEKEIAEREAARERARDREAEKRHDAEREAAERDLELQRQNERERHRELDREQRRARRAERERAKELEKTERERRKQQEREERERQKQIERAERERLKALEQAELEKQKEEERLRRERKERERVERERQKAERETERAERERMRDKTERERERATKSTMKHRSHRDKSQSMPTNTLPGATSGSDTDRMMSRKDARRRSQSFSTVPQLHATSSTGYRGEPRVHAQESPGVQTPTVKKDSAPFQYGPAETFHTSTTAFPNPPSRADIANTRSVSAAAFPTQPQESTPPRAPERGQSDSLLPAEARARFDPSRLQEKLVSIYASQGPSDRSAYRPSQKTTAGQSTVEQQFVKPPTTTSTARKELEDYPRSSLEQASRCVSVVQPNSTPPKLAPPTPHEQSQHEPAPVAHETATNQSAAFYARYSEVPTSTSITPASRLARSDAAQSGPAKVAPALNTSSFSVQSAHSTPPEQTHDRLQPAKFGASTPHGAGFSKELPRAPADDQQSTLALRVPSNNATRSPSRKTVQLPSGSDALQAEPVSRTASDASRSSGHRHSPSSHGHLQLNPASSQPQQFPGPSVTPSPMYSSTLNASHTSRHRHESVTTFHQQTVPHTHTHFQSFPQQYNYNTSKDDAHHPRHDSLPNGRPIAHIPASDVSHHRYPASQATGTPSKLAYNPSTNQPAIAQSNSSLPPSIPDAKPPTRPPVISNNVSSYSAAVANLPPLSQMSSTMHSHPQSTLSQNPPYSSSTRNHVPAYPSQRYQTEMTPPKPVFPPPGTSDPSDPTTKSSFPRSSHRPGYITTTRSSGPFIDESPSSTGGGLSLDSPPPVKPPLPQPSYPSEQSAPQPANRRPDSHLGPLANYQPKSSAENRPSSQPQMDDIPPLTPSSSSHESNEEILMTPASLNQARTQVDVRQPSDSSQRSEKKRGGLLKGLFRSNSTKSTKEKERPEQESRKQVPGSQRDQRTETVNKPGSTRPPSIMITQEAGPNTESTGQDQSKQQLRVPKPVPPPISIPPPESFTYRLFSRSKRHRTMSSASLEAVDGTANNTVVGSPTSSRRSPTPSGPMTPPVRDPMEATRAWRNNEDVFLDPGSQRRRRPGVTFDLKDNNDGQKDGAQYRRSRQHRQRRDSLR